MRRIWNPPTRAYVTDAQWNEASPQLSGDEPQKINGDREVIAVPGDELMPCGLVLLSHAAQTIRLVESETCRRKYAAGISAAQLAPISRRADIERVRTTRKTYEELVAQGRLTGRNEGQAMLEAVEEMRRRGQYPNTRTLVATSLECNAALPFVSITDMEFADGLFADIEAAIKNPGAEIEKSLGAYITHRDYTTSQQINDYLGAGNTVFFIRTAGASWRMTIHRP